MIRRFVLLSIFCALSFIRHRMIDVKFKMLSNRDTILVRRAYSSEYKTAKEAGLYTEKEMLGFTSRNDLYTGDAEEQYEMIQGGHLFKYPHVSELAGDDEVEKSNFLEDILLCIIYGERTVSGDELIQLFDNRNEDRGTGDWTLFDQLANIRSTYVNHTCERFADSRKNKYMLYLCCYNPDTDERIWDSMEELEESLSTSEYNILVYGMLKTLNMNVTTMRRLARSPMWRSRWITATKTGQNIFEGEITNWDINKVYLCYWSNFYDNVYESPERPEEFIMKDDEMLDNYLEQKSNERENEKKGATSHNLSGGDTDVARFKVKVNPIKKGE